MPTMLSPGVVVVEKDFTNIIPTVSSGIGAIAGRFSKGPVNMPIMISSEDELVSVFGKPNNTNANEWFTASQFLQYTNKLWVVRISASDAFNATSGSAGVLVRNETEYSTISSGNLTTASHFISRNPGVIGNAIGVIVLDAENYTEFTTWSTNVGNLGFFPDGVTYDKYFTYTPSTTEYTKKFSATANDEVFVMVVDLTGAISGVKNYVLETFVGLSKAADAVNYKGESIYYAAAINNNSKYVWWAGTPTYKTGSTGLNFGDYTSDLSSTVTGFKMLDDAVGNIGPAGSSSTGFYFKKLAFGTDGGTVTEADIQNGYKQFLNTELYDLNLILCGAFPTTTLGSMEQYIVQSIAAKRKDAIAFFSPHTTTGTAYFDSDSTPPVTSVPAFKSAAALSETYASYGVMDTGFKYIYDRYNNKYRWVPLNGDIAGICAYTDDVADPWYSPGGFNRGGVKNVVKLSYNPDQADRDILYPKGINPVVSFPGQGVVLFGDRTATTKPSAFDRINVRRLFLILEKAISIAAKYMLFEFNDSFTRAQFRSMVEPYLRNIQGRRGITDFMVQCDESNNPGSVIDSNNFVASIYVKPARSINFIVLNFVATRTDVSFSTVVGG